MTEFPIHTPETAPAESKQTLEDYKGKYGLDLNIFGSMANAPALLNAYPVIQDLFDQTSLSAIEQQLVLLATSTVNECLFCVPAHSTNLRQGVKADDDIINAAREGRTLPDPKLDALVNFTRSLVKNHSKADPAITQAFFDAGYTQQQALEVVLGIASKTMTNYTSSIAGTPIQPEFEGEAWSPSQLQNAA